ncbi:hypothetical protein HOY80DRAFT_343704 [Tuber brumale]|nr:hypothetical protein HOY80DRAFT_343704 [Tuber brumale]
MGLTVPTLRASAVICLVLTPQALAADGADFSNNLFSDLAPVLALFGEQVSKQFLSQSLTWLEDVIFAMAPLGIITAIVSAVRVGGPGWLKAVVGRARESRAVAEVELMSSTSHEVCELWNGEAIVRVMGSPKVAELLCFPDGVGGQGGLRFFTFDAAVKKGILRKDHSTLAQLTTRTSLPAWILLPFEILFGRILLPSLILFDRILLPFKILFLLFALLTADAEDAILPRRTTPISAPNLSLNICGVRELGELWLFAILGIVLQFGCLIFIGVTHYHPEINWKADENPEYAYPLMASGTLVLVIGMMACSYVVQYSSEEGIWVAEKSFWIMWLQKGDRVNDQLFGSYALFGGEERKKLITSRRRVYKYFLWTPSRAEYDVYPPLSLRALSTAGAFVSIAGFVIQFVGIRALHWSASIAQLVVTLAMTTVRTWIRRNISTRPQSKMLPIDYEIDWLAVGAGKFLDKRRRPKPSDLADARNDNLSWEVVTLHGYLGYEDAQKEHALVRDAQTTLGLRKDLGDHVGWNETCYPIALKLVNCLQSLLPHFMDSGDTTPASDPAYRRALHWALPVKLGKTVQYITMTASRGYLPRWNVDASELCSVISLWCYGVESKDTQNTHLLRNLWADPETALRVLGPATHRFVLDCGRWIDGGGRFAVVENSRLLENKSEGQVTEVKVQELSEIIARAGDHTDHTTDPPTDAIAPYCIMGAKPIDTDRGHKSLASVSMGPFVQMCAQEILSAFLWAIVGIVHPIPSDAQSRSATPPGDHESINDEQPDSKLENSSFQQLAEIITNSGVTSSIQDAFALIIPPFATAGKLPRRPSDELTQDEVELTRPDPTHQ